MVIDSSMLSRLTRRGFISQNTDEAALTKMLSEKAMTLYAGFDPTADSLHVGHLIPIMALGHFAKAGHRSIALIGGGTAMVGDPSGKTEMRKMLSKEQIEANSDSIASQLQGLLGQTGEVSYMSNASWLLEWSYIDFLREIGRHFSVNRMLTAEAYKMRLERGLSFIEFNYQLLQAFDFAHLAKQENCYLQIGGDDQWGNIVAGIDLIRRLEGKQAYGITFPLLTTATGQKMGKTEGGAVWLDAHRTSPYEYYQYWVNCDDRDVHRFLSFFTYLPEDEIDQIKRLQGDELNTAKTVLAFEATAFCHGIDEARKAQQAAWQAFGARAIPDDMLPSSKVLRKPDASGGDLPSSTISEEQLAQGIQLVELLVNCQLCESKSAARRLIKQGGAYIDKERVADINHVVTLDDIGEEGTVLRAGKKKYHRIKREA